MPLSSLLQILKKNTRLTRRQACRLGGIFGLSFYGLGEFRATHAFARRRNIFEKEKSMKLPIPMLDGDVSLERAIKQRRTIRSFVDKPLTVGQLSQILWAAQGITDDRGLKRAAPSGGALYPIDIYAVMGKNGVRELAPGIYHYDPIHHSIQKIAGTDAREDVAVASLRQMWMATAPVILVLTAEYRRITIKYGERGKRYAMIETGHIGQNIFLQCQAIGLSAGIVGAFYDKEVTRAINSQKNHEPLIIMPVGWER
ncbi:MAG: SagB/ThcOx family dehydrogenase [Desulfobacterales bacterium]|nr:SagB/ThcOx family dehydrogenase [Desulfobacterales bacterium]